MSNLETERLYFVWLYVNEVMAQVPARAVNVSEGGNFRLRFYDLNGVSLSDDPNFIPPDDHPATENDRRENWPEEFNNWLRSVIDFFRGVGNWFGDNWGLIVTVLIIAAIVIAVIILFPAVVPIVGMILKGVFMGLFMLLKGIAASIKMVFAGLAAVITMPFGNGGDT